MRSRLDIYTIDPVSSSSLYSPQSCPVCCEDYKKGDDIVWSRNDGCHHVFHLDCIMTWLMQHDNCPLCRLDYLRPSEEQEEGTSNTQQSRAPPVPPTAPPVE
mmetsp:Transcript_4812/g.7259  ORF Transcript_4812/g.7259 Transcript_4812/m.7259 type:complete len:102 (-) Transcript_4812:482-787(-)